MKRILNLCVGCLLCTAAAQAENEHPIDTLSMKRYELGEVVVTGSRIPIARDLLPVPVSVVSRHLLEQSGETTILPALTQQVPGLFVTSRGIAGYGVSGGSAGGINLRGMGGGAGRVLILIDGHPQYATIYGHPVADAYIASDAQRVEVSRGPSSVLYGSNAMAGAVNIITRQATQQGNSLNVRLMGGSYGTQRYSLTDSYRQGPWSAVVSGNYERTDGHRPNSGFELFSGFGKVGYDLSEEWKVTANVNIAQANSNNPGTVSNPMYEGTADVLRGMSGLSLENNYGMTRGALNLYYNWGNHKINDGYTEGGSPREFLFRSTDYMGGLNLYQAVNLFTGNTLTGGFDVKLYGGNAYRNPVTEIYADHVRLHEIAGYVFAQQEWGRFMINAGLRLENHKLYGTEWVPQGGISFRAAKETHLKFSVSKGFRTPNMRELYMYDSANEDLLPERSLSYDLSVSQRLLDNRLSMELALFYIKGDNIVETVPVDGNPKNRNVGEFANKGVEFSLSYQILTNLSLHSNYSYLHMDTNITGAPRNKFYAGMTYRPGRFTLSAGAQVIDRLLLSTGDQGESESYLLVDTRVAYRAWKWGEVFVKGDNLLAQKYETMLGFPMPRATVMGGVSLNF